eukprot:gb/GFBE01001728.1/.p1 GENE.gb/GFBE01001728.1/~~gb/GFBE01001728.1/.p1  ORF type:complete len:162 (+),score=33.48 gb/GFBE01001728.1/:1-486(+)
MRLPLLDQRAPPPQPGLSDEQLAELPSFVFGEEEPASQVQHGNSSAGENASLPGQSGQRSSEEGGEAEDSSCSICLESFTRGQRVRRLPCSHEFHLTCIDDWLKRTASCPMRCPGDFKQQNQGEHGAHNDQQEGATSSQEQLQTASPVSEPPPTLYGQDQA